MKLIITLTLALLFLALTAGCNMTRTLSPEDFLYTYRSGGLPGEPAAGSSAVYTGIEEDNHCLRLTSRSPSQSLMGDGMKVKCPAAQLPGSFPSGFEPARNPEDFEAAEDTREYVRSYLQKKTNDSKGS